MFTCEEHIENVPLQIDDLWIWKAENERPVSSFLLLPSPSQSWENHKSSSEMRTGMEYEIFRVLIVWTLLIGAGKEGFFVWNDDDTFSYTVRLYNPHCQKWILSCFVVKYLSVLKTRHTQFYFSSKCKIFILVVRGYILNIKEYLLYL